MGRVRSALAPFFGGLTGLGMTACADGMFCAEAGCEWTDAEWQRVTSLSGAPDAPLDPTNRYVDDPDVAVLGQMFFFDPAFSGPTSQVDALGRTSPAARTAKGEPSNLSCASCHDLARRGVDASSVPGHVSVGAGWMDTNALPIVNVVYREHLTWNGRWDSVWGLAATVVEGPHVMNGSRLNVAWTISEDDEYRTAYNALFAGDGDPLPLDEPLVGVTLHAEGVLAGQCNMSPCGPPCRQVESNNEFEGCWPRFPMRGKPGKEPGCQPPDPAGELPTAEPAGDAFDCMLEADRERVTRVVVNFGKAIHAYLQGVVSFDAPFDRFVAEGADSDTISPEAQLGARLFVGKAGCIACHSGPSLTDESFHNVGVPQTGVGVITLSDCPAGGAACDCESTAEGKKCAPWGAFTGLSGLPTFAYGRGTPWSDDPSAVLPERPVGDELKGAWRTPSLRDVALTGPYMHDGVLRTLEEVIWHYDVGGQGGTGLEHQAPELRPLHLSADERSALARFLETLSGTTLPTNLAAPP